MAMFHSDGHRTCPFADPADSIGNHELVLSLSNVDVRHLTPARHRVLEISLGDVQPTDRFEDYSFPISERLAAELRSAALHLKPSPQQEPGSRDACWWQRQAHTRSDAGSCGGTVAVVQSPADHESPRALSGRHCGAGLGLCRVSGGHRRRRHRFSPQRILLLRLERIAIC